MLKKVVVIGLGYVGLPLALRVADKGYVVTGIDLDKSKIEKISNGEDPIGEDFIKELLPNTSLKVTSSSNAIKEADITIVCVPTPVKNDYEPDLGPVKGAIGAICKGAKKGSVVIVESTINPGVCDEVVIPLFEENGIKVNRDIHVSHCPERINPGDPKWDVTNIPRVVGSSSPEGLKLTVEFYENIIDANIKQMGSIKEAEACKVVENSFRDVNIAFVNELAKSFSKLGINVKNVIDGAATKPFAFMAHYPSVGVGGHCIPVDPYYLIEYARGYGFEHEFLSLARSINNSMPHFTVDQLRDALDEKGASLKDLDVLVLGLSYKANVGDDRESPSYELIEILKSKNANVHVYDPYFIEKSTVKTLDEGLKKAKAIILASNHQEFLECDFSKSDIIAFIDGKNAISKNKVGKDTVYKGIGTA